MAIHKIYYDIKYTSANTDYLQISSEDKTWLIEQLIKIQSYIIELQTMKNKDVQDVMKCYFFKKTKTLPYNNNFKNQNTPMSFVAGLLNNLMFGNQHNVSKSQSENIENIMSMFVTLTEAINIVVQKNTTYDSVLFIENIFKIE
jgi:hypothetical protein